MAGGIPSATGSSAAGATIMKNSIGLRLFKKIAWKKKIEAAEDDRPDEASSEVEQEEASVLDSNDQPSKILIDDDLIDDNLTLQCVLSVLHMSFKPKNDHFGLGFDPHKNAPEFRKAQEATAKPVSLLPCI